MHPERVTDAEIDLYLDGELELRRRLDVEDYLAKTPAAAAEVMADLRTRTSLLLAQSRLPPSPPVMLDAAAKLAGRLASHRSKSSLFSARRLRAAGSVGVIGLLGFPSLFTASVSAQTPAYVADAVMAYRTAVLRAAMPSQIESRVLDLREIKRNTSIRVPSLPVGWKVTDVQIFPSDDGPALQIMVRRSTGDQVSIFAIRAPSRAPQSPVAIRTGSASVAYWRTGEMSYALTGMEAPEALDIAAEDLADNRSI